MFFLAYLQDDDILQPTKIIYHLHQATAIKAAKPKRQS